MQIIIQDPNQKSLFLAKERWDKLQTGLAPQRTFYKTDLPKRQQKFDLAIIATTAAERPSVVKKIIGHFNVNYWVLEKVLAQNMQGIDDFQCISQKNSLAWVNHPRRMVPWHSNIRAQIQSWKTLQLKVVGGPWGLACNATHFFDFVEWVSGEKLVDVITDRLDSRWSPAKRLGHFEVFGTLEGRFSKGSVVFLDSSRDGPPFYQYELTDGKTRWLVNEEAGLAQCSNGEKIKGRLPYQSEMTGPLVDEILATGGCQLTSLKTSVATHRVYIQAMLQHWRDHHNPQATFVPIT